MKPTEIALGYGLFSVGQLLGRPGVVVTAEMGIHKVGETIIDPQPSAVKPWATVISFANRESWFVLSRQLEECGRRAGWIE